MFMGSPLLSLGTLNRFELWRAAFRGPNTTSSWRFGSRLRRRIDIDKPLWWENLKGSEESARVEIFKVSHRDTGHEIPRS